MNYIDQTLDLLEKLIKLCKRQQREIKDLKKTIQDNNLLIHDLRNKWQQEVDKRLSMK
jgi:hypothetical protein